MPCGKSFRRPVPRLSSDKLDAHVTSSEFDTGPPSRPLPRPTSPAARGEVTERANIDPIVPLMGFQPVLADAHFDHDWYFQRQRRLHRFFD